LLIDDYFQVVYETIEACLAVHSSSITYDKRTSYEGFVKGNILFLDGSVLHVREFVNVETGIERYMYAYHYQRDDKFVFRYDNTEHHRKLKLPTFPHHKHDGDEANVIASSAPILAAVLAEIASLLDYQGS
jgi:prepilin-type processing-associated H-X9-DG protein